MAEPYCVASGIWYAPDWQNPVTGRVVGAHSLGTRDRAQADARWAIERARGMRPVAASENRLPPLRAQLTFELGEKLEDAVGAYLAHKRHGLKPATVPKLLHAAERCLDVLFFLEGRRMRLRDVRLCDMQGERGTGILAAWTTAEIARLGGRTHTVVKRLRNVLKPALKHAFAKGQLAGLPIFPEVKNDYRARGRRTIALSRAEFAVICAELAEIDAIRRRGAPAIRVFPRLAAEVAAGTGLHESDLNRFSLADWDRAGNRWYRRNSKGSDHYPPEWFPCDPLLKNALERASVRFAREDWDHRWDYRPYPPACRDCGAAARLWLADGPLPEAWMRQRLRAAVRRGRLRLTHRLSLLDFRHTFASWRMEEGWELTDTARVLGNSSGMVAEIYARAPAERFARLTAKSEAGAAEIARIMEAVGPRRGPRISRLHHVADTVVKTNKGAT